MQFSYKHPDTGRIRRLLFAAEGLTEQQPDSALALLTAALQESRQAGYGIGTGMALYYMGYVYHIKSLYRESISAYRQALLYAEREPRMSSRRASMYNAMAVQYMYLGDYYQSIVCLSRAALLIEKGQAGLSMSNIYNNIPIVMRLADPGGAVEGKTWYYLELAEKTARSEKNYAGLASALNSKGIYYGRQRHWRQSLHALSAALETARAHNLPSSQVSALNNIATVYLQIDSPQKALLSLQEAQAVKGNAYTHHRIRTIHILGQLHYGTGNYKTAERLLLEALEQGRKTHFIAVLPEIYETLSQLYTVTKRYPEALTYYKKYVAARDSLTRKEVTGNIHQLEVRYRTAQKDKEIIQKEFQIALQNNRLKEKNTWIISSTAGALLLAVLLIGAYRNNRHRQRLQAEKIRNLEQQQEIVRLRSVMKGEEKERTRIARELHDGIVGQLSAVRLSFGAVRRHHALDETEDFADALQQLDETVVELRKMAHNLMPGILLQAGMAEAIHIYCNKMNKGASPAIRFHTSGAIPRMNPDFELAVYRITQELIQNAVKHAQADSLLVQLDYQDGLLGLTVEDDGSGFDYRQPGNGDGIGLQNLQARVKTMNGTLTVTSAPGTGTSVYLEFDTDSHGAAAYTPA